MNYESFKADISLELSKDDRIPKNLVFSETIKNNGVPINTLAIKNDDETIVPSIHMDGYYNDYVNGRSASDIAKTLAEIYLNKPNLKSIDPILTWSRVKDHIIYTLVNYERNKEFLQAAPHFKLLDLALIFKIDSAFLNISGTISITNTLMEHLKTDKKTLLSTAIKNTELELPLLFVKLTELLSSFLTEEEVKSFSSAPNPPIWVCTNADKTFGASAVLYKDFRDALDTVGIKDCYILPSSVHELLVIDCTEDEKKSDLEMLVTEVNASGCVDSTDFLSNRVYKYSEIVAAFDELLHSAAREK